jgi:MFS transporter, CP family, cyanate transporter
MRYKPLGKFVPSFYAYGVPPALAPARTRPAPVTEPAVKGKAMVLAGILLVALNLRAAITSLGALLPEVSGGLHLSGTLAGLITTLPALSFAGFGALTPLLTRRVSAGRVLLGAMVALALGQAARAVTESALVFLLCSTLAMAGIAVANVLLPSLVRTYFPHRAGLVTGVYTMTMIAGAAAGAAASVPVAKAFHDWRVGLGVWAVLAVIAALPWIVRSTPLTRPRPGSRLKAGRTRLGWAMAVYFGAQALSGYATMGWLARMFRDAGFSAADAGLLLAGVTVVGIPLALLMPALAGRVSPRPLVLTMSGAMVLSYLGMAFAPHAGALLWVTLLAIGQAAFPLALALIGMRARTPQGIVALSAFAQSTGYLIAALGPLVVGTLYEVTGGWMLPLGFLILAAIVQAIAGLAAARPRFLEDVAGPI